MPGPIRFKQTSRPFKALKKKERPACLGLWVDGDPACGGKVPCSWRNTCRVYQDFCAARGVVPATELDLLPWRAQVTMIHELVRTYSPKGGRIPPIRVVQGWDRFLEAYRRALGRPVIQPGVEHAERGEVYVHTWRPGDGWFWCRMIRARRENRRVESGGVTGRRDRVLVRYFPYFKAMIAPTIEFPTPLEILLERYPQARDFAYRWRGRYWASRPIGAAAIRVYPERIGDCARLAVRLLSDGLITQVRLDRKRGRIQFSYRKKSKVFWD